MSLLARRTTAVRRAKQSGEQPDATPRQDNPAGDHALAVYVQHINFSNHTNAKPLRLGHLS
jgi:hypothetical protein